VPLIFGSKWVAAIPILVLICLSALPRPFANAASQLLRAVDKSHIDLYWNLIFTVIFIVALLIGMQGGIYWVAASVLISHALTMPLFTVWASRYVFAKKTTLPAINKES
jgi:PST family polysaccharide transporter